MNARPDIPRRRAFFFMSVIALLVIMLDQLVKWFMLEHIGIAEGPPIIITSWFKLVMVWNHGVSFGMLSAPGSYVPYFLILVALLISALLGWLGLRAHHRSEWLAYALVIGGALGNVIDRLRFGAVADFFYFHLGALGWPAFNVADAAICCGVALLLWHSFFPRQRA
ncbi:MAG: signal peptidase II [Alphaproteobacteria bacterium]|jgi:signal peptidase II